MRTRKEQLGVTDQLTFSSEEEALDWAATILLTDKTRVRLIDKKADRDAQLLLEMDSWEEPCYESICAMPITQPDWLISDYIERGTVGFLSGIFGSAKSFIALDWACCVATGSSWLDHRIPHEGNVIYIAAEGMQGIGRRYAAWCKENGRAVRPENMDVIQAPVQLGYQPAVDWLVKRIRDFRADFLIIDTLARSTSGLNENDAIDMGKVVDAMYAFRDARDDAPTTVLMVHHSGWADQSRSRGSSRLPSDTDFAYNTTRGDDTKPYTLKCTKLKEDELPPTLNFTLGVVPVGDGITSCVIRPAAPPSIGAPPDDEETDTQAMILAALKVKDGQSGMELADATGRKRSTVSRALGPLKLQGKVECRQDQADGRIWWWYLAGRERNEAAKLVGAAKRKK